MSQRDGAVSRDDVRAAWFDFFARPDTLAHVEVLPPEHPAMHDAQITLDALERVLQRDRARVRARST